MDWGVRLVELVRRALKSAAQSRIIRKNLYHNFDCASEQKNRHLPGPAGMFGKKLECRLHYTVLISLNKGFGMY